MKHAPARHFVQLLLFRALTLPMRHLPHRWFRPLGRRLGAVAHAALASPRRLALRHVEMGLPELPPEERKRVVRECFAHFGGYFCELLSLARLTPQGVLARFDVSGWEHLERAAEGGRGFFLTAGHYGAWELSLYPLGIRLGNVYAVARPLDNPRVDRDLRRVRERFGIQIIDKAGAAHRMLNAYRRGGRVAMVIDQHVRPSAGIQVPFLGLPAWTSPVLAMLSTMTGAPVVPLTCVPAADDRFQFTVHPPIFPEGKGDEVVAELTRRYLSVVEEDIRRDPALWLWMHRRWRQMDGAVSGPEVGGGRGTGDVA